MLEFNAPSVFVLATIAAVCLAVPANGDIVIKNDATMYEGEITEQTSTYLKMRTKIGGKGNWIELTFSMTSINSFTEEDGDQAVDAASPAPAPPAGEPASKSAGSAGVHRVEEVVARGSGATEREAIDHALRNAVQQVVGTLITSTTQIEHMDVVEDKIIAHANGFVRKYEVIDDPRRLGTPDDPHVEVRILAEVEITKMFEQFNSENILITFKKSFDADSIYAAVTTREDRDKAAAQALREVLAGYPNRVWTVKPIGKIREAGKTQSGEVILAAKIRFEKTRGQWASFAADLKSVLNRVAIGNSKISLVKSQYSLAVDCVLNHLSQLDNPFEVRQKIGLQDYWGQVSVDRTSRTALRGYWPITSYSGEFGSVMANEGRIEFEDTVVLLDRNQRHADVWAVPEEAWDVIQAAIDGGVPEVYVSLVNGDGEIGRPLFGRDQSRLQGDFWEGPALKPDILKSDRDSPRRNYISPFMSIGIKTHYIASSGGGCGGGNNHNDGWAGPSIDIEYLFAIPKEELTGTPNVKVELVSRDTFLPDKPAPSKFGPGPGGSGGPGGR